MVSRILVLDGDTRQSLPVMRALRKAGHHVTVACESRLSVGWFSRLPHRRVLLPPPSRPAEFADALERLVSAGDYDVTIPLFDLIATLVVEHRERLDPHTSIPLPPGEIFALARDKAATMKICAAHDIPAPRTFHPDEEPVAEIAERLSYPALVKPSVGHGAIGIAPVRSGDDLAPVLAAARKAHGPCLLQEFIPHTGLQYKAQLFRDESGGYHAGIVFSKIRFFPVTGGTSSLNCTVDRPDVLETCRRLLDAMGWIGYADVDLIEDPRDGQVKVMEVNPRVTGSVKIAFAAGIDFSDLLVCQALGREYRGYPGDGTKIYMRYLPLDILWFLYSPERFRARPSWFRFWGRDLCYQVLSPSDPGPFLALGLSGLARLAKPSVRESKLRRKN